MSSRRNDLVVFSVPDGLGFGFRITTEKGFTAIVRSSLEDQPVQTKDLIHIRDVIDDAIKECK